MVVGIDHYDYAENWKLDGPVADALRIADWLLSRGVKQQHIALFLSPASWQQQDVLDWADGHGWQEQRDATFARMSKFVNEEVRLMGGGALFVYWGGHGVVDDQKPLNYLLTSDAVPAVPYCLCVQDLLDSLSGSLFAHLMQQVCIFDVCASPFARLGDIAKPIVAPLVGSLQRQHEVRQCFMIAASQGRLAANITRRKAGLFSELLLAQLAPLGAPTLQQFADAFALIKHEGPTNGLLAQSPMITFNDPGNRMETSGWGIKLDSTVEALFTLIASRDIAPERIRRFYIRSLADYSRNVCDQEMVKWLVDLHDTRPRSDDHPSPLIEFALRLGSDVRDPVIVAWAKANSVPGKLQVLSQMLANEAAAEKPMAALFIDIDRADATELRWFLETPDPERLTTMHTVSFSANDPANDFAHCLSRIVEDALTLVGLLYDLRIGFLVSPDLFSSGLAGTRVQIADNIGTDEYGLDERYPVLFHWRGRVGKTPSNPRTEWQKVLSTLEPRLARDVSAKVVWLDDDPGGRDSGRYARAIAALGNVEAVCLGIDYPHDVDPAIASKTMIDCLRRGVPCFFWMPRPQIAAQADHMRTQVGYAFSRHSPNLAPLGVFKERMLAKPGDGPAALSLVWDVPGFLPRHNLFG